MIGRSARSKWPMFPTCQCYGSKSKKTAQLGWLEIEEITVSFAGPNGLIAETRMAEAGRLAVVPLLMAECVLNSSPATWECSVEFMRTKSIKLPKPDSDIHRTYIEVARVLRLSKVPQGERIASDPAPMLKRTGAASATATEELASAKTADRSEPKRHLLCKWSIISCGTIDVRPQTFGRAAQCIRCRATCRIAFTGCLLWWQPVSCFCGAEFI